VIKVALPIRRELAEQPRAGTGEVKTTCKQRDPSFAQRQAGVGFGKTNKEQRDIFRL
jgi:hypothetical protein